MTQQTQRPLERLSLDTFRRPISAFHNQRDDYDINPPYQRGSVWGVEQRRALIFSLLSGIPVPAVIIMDRFNETWEANEHPLDHANHEPVYAVVDGKQRIETVLAWVDDEFAVPASWYDPDDVQVTEDTEDGPYVRRSGLSDRARRVEHTRMLLSVCEGKSTSIRDEAAVYLLVNGGGVAQTGEDMDNAARVAASGQ